MSQRYGKTTREPIEFCSLSFHLESETVFQGVLKTYKLNLTRHIEMEQKQGGVHYGIETSTSQSGISFSNREVSGMFLQSSYHELITSSYIIII